MTRPFVTLDVFTHHRLAGNPLAVVLDGSGFDTPAMQAIAREFNLSETVFVMPPRDPSARAALRIFTPARELPFAGHPTVGTAVLLALLDGRDADFVLEEEVGPVPCRATRHGDQAGEAVFVLPRLPEQVRPLGDAAACARAFGLDPADLMEGYGPAIYSAGVAFTIVPLRSRAAVDRARVDAAAWNAAFGDGPHGAYLVAFDPVDPAHHVHARMLDVGFGIGEDPATGSAAAAFAGFLMAAAPRADGEHRFVIEQGYQMGRPSQITLTLHVAGGRLHKAEIGGGAVIVTRGTLAL